MPRLPRQKSYDSIYHVMSRSISEVDLFKDEDDKIKYLTLLKEYQEIFEFKVYAYCLMDNHCHFIIDVNGVDITKIFHGLNFKYAMYFNKRHKRHGHLFQDRFKSKIVDKENYLITLSGYIHANPLSIEKYNNRIEAYEYSSLGIYLGIIKDKFELINMEFLLNEFSQKEVNAQKLYLEFVKQCTNDNIKAEIEFKNEETLYLSQRKILVRDYSVERIIEFLTKKIKASELSLKMKSCKETVEQRAIFSLFMRCFCNYGHKDICYVLGNMSQSRVSTLCSIGRKLIREKEEYRGLLKEFIGFSI